MSTVSVNEASSAANDAHAGLTVIDTDVHPIARHGLKSVLPYMSQAWRRRMETKGVLTLPTNHLPLRYEHPSGHVIRVDTQPPDGGPGGSDPRFLVEQLVDGHGISGVILNSLQAGQLAAAVAGPEESVAICSAFNDFFIAEWLSVDRRLRLAITVPTQDPVAAAAEVRRLGATDGVAAVYVPLINIRMGSTYYHPIYQAAEELELPVFMHVTGSDYVYQGAPEPVGGLPASYAERYVTMPQIGAANLASLIFSGTLERFPRMKVLFAEFGFTWVVPQLWRMDDAWRALRHETPWVREAPSAYVRERIRFTTQAVETPPNMDSLYRMIDELGHDVLTFSTDYPHWDNDMPHNTLPRLSRDARRRIFGQNAIAFFGAGRLGLADA